jgi:adenylate cyclase
LDQLHKSSAISDWYEMQSQLTNSAQYVVRALRATTGLVLFTYATSHLLNHAFGIRSIAAMQATSAFLLAPWQSSVGLFALYGSFFAHAMLGLLALYRRRHFRMPMSEAAQLTLGLTIPLMLLPHAGSLRIGYSIYGMDSGYAQVLYQLWVSSPEYALPRQFLLVLVVWIHGCIGLRAWLRAYHWYSRAAPLLSSLATLVPALGFAGVVSAGLSLRSAVEAHSIDLEGFRPPPVSVTVAGVVNNLMLAYVVLVLGIFVLRAIRNWHAKRFHSVAITYPQRRKITVLLGLSILEASRWAGIPHESVCGGRGRCSTCRVRILEGADKLPPPDTLEQRTLRRIDAAPNVRLACQVRPASAVTVEPLVRPQKAAANEAMRFDAAIGGGTEVEIAAMFVDIRGSTELARGRLPYDALFLFDRYIQVVTGAIRAHGGHVTSIAGDGVMSVFGMDRQATARGALQSALGVWSGVDSLNTDLASELSTTLNIGIGLHFGTAVVGWVTHNESKSLQFLGDTGNVAAKLEAQSKILNCKLVVSLEALDAASITAEALETTAVPIPGRAKSMNVAVIRQRRDLERVLGSVLA